MMRTAVFLAVLLAVSVSASFGQETKLKIIEQPRPELPARHSTLDVQGTVGLRVEFREDGTIGEVNVVKHLTNELDQLAMKAVQRIKFEPERRDGKAVAITRTLEYTYSWNGGWREIEREQDEKAGDPAKAEEIIKRAVAALGGDSYLKVTSQIGRGRFSLIREGTVASFQSFVDIIVFPNKELTEFKGAGMHTVQANSGDTGWVFDADEKLIKQQNAVQLANFKFGIRTNLDTLLRGYWRGEGEVRYTGRRRASLGKRNDVVRLIYKDGLIVEFEFAADDALPQKVSYKRLTADGEEIAEEDRYAQFVDIGGVKVPFIIDRFTDGKQSSRINYESVEFNRTIPDSVFAMPKDAKAVKKQIAL